ncbi:unnamed protein product [Trifolium pratense]|uniref:Uncharacterized protein n=1 Tax=Trifolium pratense TaxID=57577 RepID=A0ACB0LYM7_TRIPR|nr:unnamed protein product [Trifolium pratense]
MVKTLKLIFTILLFLFPFLTTKEAAITPKIITTSFTCKSVNDCPVIVVAEMYIAICMKGYCHRMTFDP